MIHDEIKKYAEQLNIPFFVQKCVNHEGYHLYVYREEGEVKKVVYHELFEREVSAYIRITTMVLVLRAL